MRIKRRDAVCLEVSIQTIGGEVRTSDRYPDPVASLQQVYLRVKKNATASLKPNNGRAGEEQLLGGLCRSDAVRQTYVNDRGSTVLHEFANWTEKPARSATGSERHPHVEGPIVPSADLVSENAAQRLRSPGRAERLIDESSSQE